MAVTSYPFDNQDTTEVEYSRLFRELQDSGVAGGPTGTDWRVFADSSGMHVKIQPGFAIVRGHAVQSTSVEVLTIEASSSSPRIDLVVLRLDPAGNAITPQIVKGVPGGGPPQVTQTDTGTYDLRLAEITIPANAVTIAAANVREHRSYLGTRVRSWLTASRPTTPVKGQLGWNLDLGKWEYYDGTQWLNTHTWSQITGKPATFPPDAHTHPWTAITGKPATFPPPQWVADGINTNGGAINDIFRALDAIHARLNRIGA